MTPSSITAACGGALVPVVSLLVKDGIRRCFGNAVSRHRNDTNSDPMASFDSFPSSLQPIPFEFGFLTVDS
jgi:hypothetical protein